MSTSPNLQPQAERIVTLQDIAQFAASGKGSLEEVATALSAPIDTARFNRLRRHIDAVVAAKWTNKSRRQRASFVVAQNRRKGKLFEQLMGIILESCSIFRIFGNIQTLTNEIDWLVYLGPLTVLLPLSSWGTHFICECKMSKNALDGNWTTRLFALTQTHGTPVAVLFTAREAGNAGGGGRALRAIEDYALLGSFILRFSLAELEACVEDGTSPLILLANRYIALRSRRRNVGLLSA
jgi:hypothetical protein